MESLVFEGEIESDDIRRALGGKRPSTVPLLPEINTEGCGYKERKPCQVSATFTDGM